MKTHESATEEKEKNVTDFTIIGRLWEKRVSLLRRAVQRCSLLFSVSKAAYHVAVLYWVRNAAALKARKD